MKIGILPLAVSMGVLAVLGGGRAQAQIVDQVEVNIPFEFHAGRATLPAGRYLSNRSEAMDSTVLRISGLDRRTSAFVPVISVQSGVSAAERTEVVFDRYGDDYYLSKVFEAGEGQGSQVLASASEKEIARDRTPVEQRVSATRPAPAQAN
jgi:hypothetical protein